jgi:transcription antitermination factor NusG
VTAFDESTPPWFAVYVKYRHEKCVARILQDKHYEAFLPTYMKIHSHGNRFELPLFPGYVFCRFESSNPLPILTIPGVFSIVSNGCVPVPIPDQEIESVKRLISSGSEHRPWPYVSPGQTVYIDSGPLQGIEGFVVDNSHQKWLIVSIHLLQRSVAVKIERSHHHLVVLVGRTCCSVSLNR